MFRLGRQFALLILTFAICSGSASVAFAQGDARLDPGFGVAESIDDDEDESTTGFQAESKEEIPDAKSSEKTASDGPVVLTGSDGRKYVLPRGATIDQFIEFLKKRPDFAINSVQLDGSATSTRASLTATITVEVLRDDWIRVPVYFNEAVVLKSEYEFLGARLGGPRPPDGSGNAVFGGADLADGYRWWFRGTGYHRLKLTLSIPVAKSVAQRRLRLSLPPVAAASILSLNVPEPNLSGRDVTVENPKNADVRVSAEGRSSSRIELAGLGAQLDLEWRSLPSRREGPPLLRSQTYALVRVTDESVVLAVQQRIQPLGGAASSVRVKLPDGFTGGASGRSVKSSEVDEKTNWATVTFAEPLSERIDLTWTLQRKFDALPGRFQLSGFDVEGASMQTGEIAIAKTQGLRISAMEKQSRSIHRIEPARFSAPELVGKSPVSGAFGFVQPFQLQLSSARLESQVSVRPEVRMHFSATKVTLQAEFAVSISEDGGPVEELRIAWPDWKKEDWTLDAFRPSTRIVGRRTESGDESPAIVLRLEGGSSGEMTVPFSASRELQPGEPLSFHLPMLSARVTHPATLVVSRGTSVDVDLVDSRNVPLEELRGDPPPEGDGRRGTVRRYQVDGTASLSAEVSVRRQKIHSQTSLELNAQPTAVAVRQTMQLQVEYKPVSAVLLRVPKEIAADILFFDEKQRQLNFTVAPGSDESVRRFEIVGAPTLGSIELTAAYAVKLERPLERNETQTATVPIVRFVDSEFSQVQVRSSSRSQLSIEPAGDEWERMTTLDGSPAWANDSPLRRMDAELTFPAIPRSREFSIPKSLIRAVVGADGTVRYRAQYRTSGVSDAVVLTLPSHARIDALWWGGREIAPLPAVQTTGDGSVIRIPAAGDESADSKLLTVDYHAPPADGSRWFARRSLIAPRFPPNVWQDETVWQVALPEFQHLTSFSADYFAEFHWRRGDLLWERTTNAPYDDPAAWLGDEGPAWQTTAGNVYSFRRFGPADELTVRSLSRSAIVLFGAGFAWLLGILWVKVPGTRNATTLLTAVLGVAVASLWFAEELLVMLQPAVLGMILATAFVGIERWGRRKQIVPQMSTANPSDFVVSPTPASFPERREGAAVGSEDPTVHRLPDPQPAEPASTSDLRGRG